MQKLQMHWTRASIAAFINVALLCEFFIWKKLIVFFFEQENVVNNAKDVLPSHIDLLFEWIRMAMLRSSLQVLQGN